MKKKINYYSALFETGLSLFLLDVGEYFSTRLYSRSVTWKGLRKASRLAYGELKRVLNLPANYNG